MPANNKIKKKEIRSASKVELEARFRNVVKKMRSSQKWLSSNIYSRDTVATIALHQKNGTLKPKSLGDYIAVSAPLHMSDGWSFLSRSFDSLSSCDGLTCVHLAYYAELRAVMSLLGAQGIGVFNHHHYAISSSSSCVLINSGRLGTHKAAWEILDYWSSTKAAGESLAKILTPGNVSIESWIIESGLANSIRPLTKKWLTAWGLDIKHFSDDRDARNLSSYRPNHHWSNTEAPEVKDFLGLQNDIWSLLEPSPNSNFQKVDRHLLRLAFEISFKAKFNRWPTLTDADYLGCIDQALSRLNPIGFSKAMWKSFLIREIEAEDLRILSLSQKTTRDESEDYAYAVVARAFLLLRIATGSAALLSKTSALSEEDLSFWLDQLGTSKGFWGEGDRVSPLSDLWLDIKNSLNDLDVMRAKENDDVSFLNLKAAYSGHLIKLTEFERVIMWGLELRV